MRRPRLLATAAPGAAIPLPARAQEGAIQDGSKQIKKIIGNAQKPLESVQCIPLSVESVVSGGPAQHGVKRLIERVEASSLHPHKSQMATSRQQVKQAEAPVEDHRVRVGRQRSEKMRRHLLRSVLEVCSGRTAGGPPVIDDIIRHADVARGTFYKHFESLDQAMTELAVQLGEEMTQSIMSIYDVLQDPVMRTATGFQMFLMRAMIEPQWGAFITHIGLLSGDNLLTRKITDDIRLGVETGDYEVPSVEVASDVLMGAKIEAIQRLIAGRGSAVYVQGVAAMVLRSLGVAPAKAEKSVARALNRLHELAPGTVTWWRETPEVQP